MKRMKKVLAVLIAFTMILGMSITTMAAETGAITVNGLNANEETTVNIYQIITLDTNKNDWQVADWAADEVNKTTDPVTIDWAGLKEIVNAADSGVVAMKTETAAVGVTTVTFTELPVGAYLILANGSANEYQVMGSALYEYDAATNLIVAPAVNPVVWAKYDKYTVTKTIKTVDGEDSDAFVGRGDEVQFDITTTFPSYQTDAENRTFTITDTPTGLQITAVSVTVGGETVAAADYTLSTELPAEPDEAVTVEFTSDYIGDANEHAGKAVVVTVTAIVTSDTGYSNTASTDKAEEPSDVTGYTGDATITKYGEDTTDDGEDNPVTLIGAQFQVYEVIVVNGAEQKNLLSFVYVSDGNYKLATSLEIEESEEAVAAGNEATVTQTIEVDSDGQVKVTGLDEGTYWFDETKAPAGYSINENGVTVTIQANAEQAGNVFVTGSITDTKLISLPTTGGIGTTIFTVAGCAIMIAAAALFFVSRRRESR